MLLVAALTAMMFVTVSFAQDTQGACGKSAQWSFDAGTGTLTVTGSGDISDYYDPSEAPWYAFSKDIKSMICQTKCNTF